MGAKKQLEYFAKVMVKIGLMVECMENIGDGMAALFKSAVGWIWLGRWMEKIQPQTYELADL